MIDWFHLLEVQRTLKATSNPIILTKKTTANAGFKGKTLVKFSLNFVNLAQLFLCSIGHYANTLVQDVHFDLQILSKFTKILSAVCGITPINPKSP